MMKKIMILLAAMAMTTLAAQAETIEASQIVAAAMEADTPVPTKGDTNGTEVAPEGK